MMFFSMPSDLGPRQRSAFDRSPKGGGLSPRSEGGVISTMGGDRSSASVGADSDVGLGADEVLFLPPPWLWCGKMFALMTVLHITYKYNPETSEADYAGFYKVITSYGWARLSQSNWTIRTNESPQAVWQ